MSKITPGRWIAHFYGKDDFWVRTGKGDPIVEIGFNQPERESNLQAIAAIPNMIELIEKQNKWINRVKNNLDFSSDNILWDEGSSILADGQTLLNKIDGAGK